MTVETIKNHFRGNWLPIFEPHVAGGLKPAANGEFQALCPFHLDTRPSLSINKESGLWRCFGCPAKGDGFDFWRKILKLADFPATVAHLADHFGLNGSKPAGGKRKVIATYDYHDSTGKVVFRVCRTQPKGFFQKRPDGRGGWINDMHGIQRVIYNLPAVLAAEEVIVAEGEKDCDNLAALGLTATCNPGGAGKWQKPFSESLRGKAVFLCGDNDDPGRQHVAQVGAALQGVVASVRVLELPGLAEKEDVSDFIALQPDRETAIERLAILMENAPDWQPPEPETTAQAPAEGGDFKLTDLGNAERLIHQYGQDLRYCYPWGKWLVWTGRQWAADDQGEVERRARQTVRAICRNEIRDDTDPGRVQGIYQHAARSESTARLQGAISLAHAEVPILPADLDRDPYLFNVKNGTINLRTGELQPHRRDHFISKIAPVEYDPAAQCPAWNRFLNRIFAGNAALIEYCQRVAGYALTGDTSEQCFFLLWGTGANGKSTFLETLRSLAGDYGHQADFQTFLLKKMDTGTSNDLASLAGARLVTGSEAGSGRSLNESLLKTATGGEPIRARFLYSEFFEFRPQFKLLLAANHKPRIRDTDLGIWRRVRLIPFEVTIPKSEQDAKLLDKLTAELPGIFNWALAGCHNWLVHGLSEPEEVLTATDDYRAAEDVLAGFIEDHCHLTPGVRVKTADLNREYKKWCEINGEETVYFKTFANLLEGRGCKAGRDCRGRYWEGIELKTMTL